MENDYNLRSRRKYKSCYLQKLLENKESAKLNPKVSIKRMKILECSEDCSFYVNNGKIMKGQSSSKKTVGRLNIFGTTFMILILISCLIYLKGDLLKFSDLLTREKSEFYQSFENYYIKAINFLYNEFGKVSYKNQEVNSEIPKVFIPRLIRKKDQKNLLEFRKYVKDHLRNEMKTNKKLLNSTRNNFIEEQCKKTFEPQSAYNFLRHSDTYDKAISSLQDYALESKGAKIVTIFDTEPYGTLAMKFWKYNFRALPDYFVEKYFYLRQPSLILAPWSKPGDCWAFKGSRAKVQVKLSEKIIITDVGIEHISTNSSEKNNSAPKLFSVVGITEIEKEGSDRTYLGTYEYKISGPTVQIFSPKSKTNIFHDGIELTVESNHGNKEYTCIYKIRIHGHK